MGSTDIQKSFIVRYVIAVSLIAILSSAAFYALILALKTSDSTAFLVNISGKQRMLSQKIASYSEQYYLYTFSDEKDPSERAILQTELQNTFQEMRKANHSLSTGNFDEGLHIPLSPIMYTIYFGDVNLSKRVETYLTLAEELQHKKTKEEAFLQLQQLIKFSDSLLPDLDKAVMRYQTEGEKNIANIRLSDTLAWLFIIFTLVLEIVFIFQPMSNKIKDLFQELSWNQQNLEQQIQLRTLKLEQANLKLTHIASHDPLTGLKNRLNLEKDLATLLLHHHENHSPFAVAMLDIDWFKKINDTYGHDVGDIVLQDISKILEHNVREDDNVYRAGGEEFVILFNRITRDEALNKTNKIRQTIEDNPFNIDDMQLHITISGGLYHPDIVPSTKIQEVLKLTDVALYDAKHSGRNQIVEVAKNNE